MPYAPTIREEELKNKVAADLFPSFDCTRILGAVGFNAKGHMNPDSPDPTYSSLIADLRAAMKALAAQIAQKVHEHGFLK